MTRRLLTLSLAAVVLAGCAGEPYRFFRDNTSQADYDRDSYDCERDTRQVERSFGYGYDRSSAAFSFAVRCMQAKGYAWLPVSAVRGPAVQPGIVSVSGGTR